MHEAVVEVDYLIIGAGAAGMAFADSLVTESGATIAIVDRHHRPGGHWNHAYPFVRLSWSLIGHVEATYQDEAEKNRICTPIPPPDAPSDWLRMMAVELSNQLVWSKIPAIRQWQAKSRLDPFTGRIQALKGTQGEAVAHLQRYGKYVGPAARRLPQLLAGA